MAGPGTVMMVAAGQLGQGSSPVMNTDYHLVRRHPKTLRVDGTGRKISMTLITETEIGRRGSAAGLIDSILTLISLVTVVEGKTVLVMIVEEGMTERIEDTIGTVEIGITRIVPEPVEHAAAVDPQCTVGSIHRTWPRQRALLPSRPCHFD